MTSSPTPTDVNPHRWRILGVLVVSLLVVVLDNTILNVALKTIQQDLNATQDQLIWAVNGYSLAFASLLFTWGVLGDRFGRKRILIIGLTLFAVASAVCAFATSPSQLIAFRVVMGIGGASVLPVSLAIITVVFPPNERGRAIGLWSASVGGAVALGPLIGGLLLDNPNLLNWLTGNDWGSVFFVNVPIIAVGLVGIIMVVPETKNPRPAKLDPQGLVLSAVGLLLLVYGIQKGDWGLWTTYAWIVAGLLILTVFVEFERRTSHPSIDLSLFRIRSFSVSLAGVSLAFAALQGTILFLAFYYQIVRGWTPLQSGSLTLAFAVGQLIAAPRSGALVDRFGARRVIVSGLSVASVGMLLIALVPINASVWYLIVMGLVFGLGLGATIAPSTTRMTLATPPAQSGSGAAVQNTLRQVGGTLGVAIISSIVATVYSHHIRPSLDASPLPPPLRDAASDSIGATYEVGGRLVASHQASPAQVQRLLQAGNDAFMPALHIAAFCALALLLIGLTLIATLLPKRAEAVAWSANSEPSVGGAATEVHPMVEEHGGPAAGERRDLEAGERGDLGADERGGQSAESKPPPY